jgi:hypothetical protein
MVALNIEPVLLHEQLTGLDWPKRAGEVITQVDDPFYAAIDQIGHHRLERQDVTVYI